ncbi:TolC family protein [Duganella violaceipulchra]|uniref:Outer membrane protein TolC n=1 Tax=Duganella violaceipulchra TaxID=2849652 RepID=A0AA41HCV6_9BURK|nr:TolC family protein [Duganella violaceicalia]MBV6323750.1 TolC family protein [Duganella violaceicalia]MCP2007439.1 outer membrane protein TolC [Duganella violaceicalia]
MSSPFSVQFNARASRLRIAPKAAFALSLLAAIHSALAAPQSLTLGEAQQRAAARSRQLSAQDQAITAANEMAVAAGQRPDPVLKIGIDNLPVSGSDRLSLGNDFMTMRRIGLSQELTRADKLHWRSARYQIEGDKAMAQKDVALAAIQRDTAIAWLEVFYTGEMAGAVSAQAAVSHQEIEAAEAAYRGGRGSSADILAAKSALLALDDRTSEVQRRQRAASTMLARWTGEETSVTGAPDIERIRLDPATLDTDLAHHPEIAVLNKQEDIAQADANLARANQHIDWSVDVAFQQRGSAYSNMVSIGISVPLQWDRKNRQDRELTAKLALVEQTKAERDEMLREHVAQTRTMIIAWHSGRERIARYTRESLPLAAERSQAMLAAYRGGKGTLADVLATRRGEVELRLQALEIELDTARLWAQLNFLFPDGGTNQHSAANSHQESQ